MAPDLLHKASLIRLLLLDIDGVMTDGVIYYGPDDKQYKGFHTQDGLGIKLIQTIGVQVGVISAKKADYIYQRLSSLNIKHIFLGHEDKLSVYTQLCTQLNLAPTQIAYMGDDLLDLPLLK